LHNTLTGEREIFQPLIPGRVGLYVCGITPYDEAHVGHARCYVVFDILKRVLERFGFHVAHVQNYTDIDDKIIERSKKLNVTPTALAEKNIASYEKNMALLNIAPANSYPRVTQNIPQIIKMVEKLITRGFAYVVDGSVNFSVRKFPDYGRLSKRKLDELEEGARVEVDKSKKDPLDFALWKKSKEGEPFWASPWGPGRPGWHIECSVMSTQALGDDFDIHGGGQDLIFPHHENEIAQACGASGKQFARFWVHNGFVTINMEKMSKSLGNFFSLQDVLAKTDPMVLRYFLLSQHYRSPLNFSDKDLKAIETVWVHRICGASRIITHFADESEGKKGLSADWKMNLSEILDEFNGGLCSDLNTPVALGALNKFCSIVFELDKKDGAGVSRQEWNSIKQEFNSILTVLGLIVPTHENWSPDILALVKKRETARRLKDWGLADQVREDLKQRGVVVEDASSGPRVRRI